MSITIDLRRDLPKVRENWAAIMKSLPTRRCEYRGPCVVGAMVSKPARHLLDTTNAADGDQSIGALIKAGVVIAPKEHRAALVALQKAFDYGDPDKFAAAVRRAERKYLASADTHPKGGDSEAAPFMSGAVAKPDAPSPSGSSS